MFIAQPSGRAFAARYKESGNTIAVEVDGDGPRFVLTLYDGMLRGVMPSIAGQAGQSLMCWKPFESDAYVSDPQILGCWKLLRLAVYQEENSAPRAVRAGACHIRFDDKTATETCTGSAPPAWVTTSAWGVRTPGVFVEEVLQDNYKPENAGYRERVKYTMSGDALTLTTFPRITDPEPTSEAWEPWKRESYFERAVSSDCK